ncbi:MAG TPA: amino acid ABC transporter permease [Actinomycetota bacterium]
MSDLWDVLVRHFPEFRSGFFITCQLVAVSFLIAMGIGTLVGALRASPSRLLQGVGAVYVEAFRNVPLLVLLFLSFAGLRRAGLEISPFAAGTASLGLYTAAYIAEALRSGVFAVGKGQRDASLALGLTNRQTLTKIVMPQAFRTVIPPLGNLIIAMIKNSAIIGVSLGLADDLLKQARLINSQTFQTNEVFFWAAVGYLILTIPTTFLVRYLETKLAIRR